MCYPNRHMIYCKSNTLILSQKLSLTENSHNIK